MHDFTPKEKHFLNNISTTQDGQRLKRLFESILVDVDSIDGITKDHAIQVEARKLVKTLLSPMIIELTPGTKKGSQQDDIDDFE